MKIYNAKTAFNTCLVALLIFASTSVFAQQQKQQRTPEERATIATNKMKETLQLSDDQYAKYETQKNAARERLKKNMELKRRQSQS